MFAEDRTSNLIVRLRHNVIRAGLRRISLAYSRISLADVASKLGLANVEDTECIVAKAIRHAHYSHDVLVVCACQVLMQKYLHDRPTEGQLCLQQQTT